MDYYNYVIIIINGCRINVNKGLNGKGQIFVGMSLNMLASSLQGTFILKTTHIESLMHLCLGFNMITALMGTVYTCILIVYKCKWTIISPAI